MKLQTLRAWGRRALVALLLGSATPLVAQQYFPNGDPSTPDEHGARWVFGGLVSFWQDNKAKTTTFDFSPEVGYLFNENWGLGVVGTYQYQKGNGESESLWALRPFARYYYMHREPFNLYLDGGFGFSTSGGVKGWEVGLRPGACVDLTKGCVCACVLASSAIVISSVLAKKLASLPRASACASLPKSCRSVSSWSCNYTPPS